MSKNDYHKNALKTSWNDVTGDFIRTGKGGNEKYAKGWDAIVWKKEEAVAIDELVAEIESTPEGKAEMDEARVHNAAILETVFEAFAKAPLTHCAAHQDGDCYHKQCPQLRDNEPACSGRSCPLYDWTCADND